MSYILISRDLAFRLLRDAATVWNIGTGQHLDPDVEMPDEPNILDNINEEDADLLHWANLILHFARTVHGVLASSLMDDETNDINFIRNDLRIDND